MLDSILTTVKSHLNGQLKEKIGLNDEQVSQIVDFAGESVQEQAQAEAMSGNTDGLLHLFGRPDAHTPTTTNPIVENMGNSFISKMTSRLGISYELAELTKNLILPYLLQTISLRFTDSNQNDTSGLLSMLQGGRKEAIFGTIKNKVSQRNLGGIL